VHSHGNQWIVATSIKSTSCGVEVYDSVYDDVNDHTAVLITNLFGSLAKPTVVVILKQLGSYDYGVHAIANAVVIRFGEDPVSLCISIKH